MSVSAKFVADFSSFSAAVSAAETKLKGFETGAGGVEKALARVGDSFSGRRILSEASLAVKAVSDLGGASKLTETEQLRLNSTLTEAIAKYKALGQTAPKDMLDLQQATAKVNTVTETATKSTVSWKSQLSSLAGVFGVAFSAAAVVNFSKELLHMGDEIVRVADRTGLTTKEVQQLSYVAAQSGNSIDELTGAIGQMQNRLASGDKSAVAAVKELGINFQALLAASPAKQMEMIATEIAKIPDPAKRTAVAMDLFGKTGTAILPTLTSQFAQLAGEAPVMSDATVKALDKAGDALGKFGLQIKVWAAESYNFLSTGFDKMIAVAYRGAAAFLDLTAKVADLASKLPGGSKVLDAMGVSVKGLTDQAQWFRDAAGAMAQRTEVVTESARRLSPVLSEVADNTAKAGKAAKATSDDLDKAAVAFKQWANSVDEASFSLRRLASEAGSVPPAIQSMDTSLSDAATTLISWNELSETATLNLKKFENGIYNLPPAIQSMAASEQRADTATLTWRDSLGQLSASFAQLGQIAGESMSGIVRGIGSVLGSFDLGLKGLDSFKKGWAELGSAKNITGILSGLGSITSGIGAIIPIAELAWKGISKLFGGPDAQEKEGRSVAAGFRAELAAMLTDVQALEAGNDAWKQSVIVVRDAYIAAGHSEQEALDILDRLWKAEKRGGNEVEAVWRQIISTTHDFGRAATSATNSAIKGFDQATNGAQVFRENVGLAAEGALSDLEGIATVGAVVRAGLSEPIFTTIKVAWDISNFPDLPSPGSGGNSKRGKASQADIDDFLRRNPGDYDRLKDAFENDTDPNDEYATGTGGRYLDFGTGTRVMLHGKERVSTEAEGRNERGMLEAIEDIRRYMRDSPTATARALVNALVQAGVA